jgi:hypothetical protein
LAESGTALETDPSIRVTKIARKKVVMEVLNDFLSFVISLI